MTVRQRSWEPSSRGSSSRLRGRALPQGRDRKSTRLKLQSRLHLVCRLLLEKKKVVHLRDGGRRRACGQTGRDELRGVQGGAPRAAGGGLQRLPRLPARARRRVLAPAARGA